MLRDSSVSTSVLDMAHYTMHSIMSFPSAADSRCPVVIAALPSWRDFYDTICSKSSTAPKTKAFPFSHQSKKAIVALIDSHYR
jgi:hypothetical protein